MAAGRIKGITVEIGGDTTKLQTALKGVNSEIKSTQSQLKDVEKLLKLDPGNTELLVQKQKLLNEAVTETKEKLATLKTAAEQANEALANGDISQEQYDALQREIIETEQDLKRLEEQANSSEAALAKIAASGEKLKSTGEAISNVGEKMLPATAVITGLGAASVKTASDFESSMSQVQATMGITKDAMSTVGGQTVNTMETLGNLAKQMGSETAFSATECAEALNYLALAGYDTEQMCNTLPTVLNLAAAGDIGLAEASDMVTDAMSALGMEVSEADTMVDQMAKTASSTNTSVAQLGEGILTIGATAKSVKGGTAELNTALGILANNGIKGAEGGTHLRNVILSLQNPTDKASEAMADLGVEVYDSQGHMRSLNDILGDLNTSMDGMTDEQKSNIISKIFNKTDLSSVNALLANTGETWDSLQNSITNSAGAAQQMADTQLDNLQGQLTLLKSALESLAISFGEALMPLVKDFVAGLQNLVNWLNSMSEGTRRVIIVVAGIVAAIGPVLIIVGKIISAVGTIMTIVPKVATAIKAVQGAMAALNAVMMANPIILIIAAIAALVAAFIYLWNTNEGFRQFWIDLWEGIKNAVTIAVQAIGEFLSAAWEAIKNTATTVWNAISGFFTSIWETISGVFTSVITAIGSFISNAFNAIKETIVGIWNAIYEVISPLLEAFRYLFETIFEAIKILITMALEAISNKISEIWNAIVEFLTPILETIKTLISTAWEAIKTAVTTVLTAIQGVVSTVWNAIKTAVTTVLNAIKNVVSSVWNSIKTTISTAMNSVKSTVSSIWNSIKSAVSSAVTGVYNTIHGGFEKAVGYIKGLASSAYSWGRDLIMGIVNGIKSAISAVSDAVTSVADKIRSVLHFSVPDEGPLTDYESWMPDFMKGLANGIEKSRSMVSKAMDNVAADMVISPKFAGAEFSYAGIGRESESTTSIVSAIKEALGDRGADTGDIVIPVYIGGTALDEIVVSAQQRINLRSGGR